MKTEKKTGGAILTLTVVQSEAERISDWAAEHLERAVVELIKPGGSECMLEIYFNNRIEAELAAQAVTDCSILVKSVREYADEEWTESWKKHFKPMNVGERLRICPPWMAGNGGPQTEDGFSTDASATAEGQKTEERMEIVLTPGLSFGTGNHFTTRFCLEQLDRFVPETGAKTMLDVGTGSGVLAIAGVKLGAERAVGVDFDPICVECAIENAQVNGVAEQTEFFQHDISNGWKNETYDIVCANIYSSLLIEHAATLWRMTGRMLMLTGIREVEIDGVAETFVRLGAREAVRDSDREWAGIVLCRRDENRQLL